MSYKVPTLETYRFQPPIKDKDLSAPPGSPVKGDRYIVAATGSGAWLNHTGDITVYNGSGWDFVTKAEGIITWINDEDVYYYYNGSAWSILSAEKAPIASPTFTTQITTPIINLTGGQIAFPASQNASAGANTLDDYEEGIWTPGVSFGGGTTGITYTTQNGKYTKIGNLVTVNCYMLLSNKGSSTGDALITGLPFTMGSGSDFYSAVAMSFSVVTFANQFQSFGVANTTTLYLFEITEAGTRTALTNGDFANTSEIIISFSYRVA